MSAQSGRDLLVKMKKPDESYQTLAGLRSKTIRFNARPIDITHADSAQGWKELLPHAGIKSAEVSGVGIFKTEESAALVRQAFFDQTLLNLRLILPSFGQIEGPFLIGSLTYSGSFQGEARFEVTLLSAGQPVFLPI